jgi:hypothetical protein
VWFEWATNSQYTQGKRKTLQQQIPAGSMSFSFKDSVEKPSVDSTYYFRIVASNSSGTRYGESKLFIPVGILPVEISSFRGEFESGRVILIWSSAMEINNYGFELERKTAAGEFEVIGFVPGHGNSNIQHDYAFEDRSIQSQTYFYRIKQIDRDGVFNYYGPVEVVVNIPITYYLSQNFPNPFNPITTIRYSMPVSSRVSIKIYNVLGQLIDDLVNTEQSAGWYETVWNANISSGLYFYRIDAVSTADPNQRFTQLKKMILLK